MGDAAALVQAASALPRWGRWIAIAAVSMLGTAAGAADPASTVQHAMHPADYAAVREALEDALAEEGLAPATVSAFGAMLARTAPDLGHRADLYREAEIFSFCSARVAGRMTSEDIGNIVLCPLTIALYTLPGEPGRVHLAYRRPGLDSPAGRLADELLARIAERTASGIGAR